MLGCAALFALAGLSGLVGCQDEHGGTAPAGGAKNPQELRIVSLTPSLTRLCVEMGLGGRVVGVIRYDELAEDPARDGLAIVTGQSVAGVVAARPTHVLLTDSPTLPAPPAVLRLAEREAFRLGRYPYPESIDDVLACLRGAEEGAVGLGVFLGDAAAAERLAAEIEARRAALRTADSVRADRPRVLLLFGGGGSGYRAAGPGTVLDEMLGLAGGRNALVDRSGASSVLGEGAVTAPRLTLAGIAALRPDAVVLFDPGGALFSGFEDGRLSGLRALPIAAAEDGRMRVETDPAALLPSLATVELAERLSAWLHGASL